MGLDSIRTQDIFRQKLDVHRKNFRVDFNKIRSCHCGSSSGLTSSLIIYGKIHDMRRPPERYPMRHF